MNFGLIGAIGGVGQALTHIGDDIVHQREQAMQWAEQEAERQRTEADHRTDLQAGYTHEDQMQTQRDTAAMARTNVEQGGATQREHDTQAAEDRRLAFTQGQENTRQGKTIAAEQNLAKLRGIIERDNTTYGANLRQQLSGDDVRGIAYGSPDKNGYSEVLIITKNSKVKSTGKKVFKPQLTNEVVGGEDNAL